MQSLDRRLFWQSVYRTKGERGVAWFQQNPQPSLGLIERFARGPQTSIVDIGGGASSLVDELLRAHTVFQPITVLDWSEEALALSKARLGPAAVEVNWIAADVTTWQPLQAFDIWHDRAAFHFLIDEDDRKAYIERLTQGVTAGGHAIIAAFAPDGPEKCSNLPVQRYDAVTLSRVVGSAFELVDQQGHRHFTPWGSVQSFQFSVLRRRWIPIEHQIAVVHHGRLESLARARSAYLMARDLRFFVKGVVRTVARTRCMADGTAMVADFSPAWRYELVGSLVRKALAEVRKIGMHEGWCYHQVQAIMLAIDQYAAAATRKPGIFLEQTASGVGRAVTMFRRKLQLWQRELSGPTASAGSSRHWRALRDLWSDDLDVKREVVLDFRRRHLCVPKT